MSKFPEYKHEKSQEWFNRALDAIPSGVYGHLGPSEGLFLPITKWPLMSDHAKGTYFWDVDGNKYLDFMCAYGPNVLGYCDDDVDKAAMEQLKRGNCTTSPSYKMVECAELLKDTVATADWAFFMKNGSDATTFSVMCARAHTGKKKMMFFKGYYHGDFQWAQKIDYPGILPEEVENNIVVPWFDMDAMQEAYDACGGDVAGLITTVISLIMFVQLRSNGLRFVNSATTTVWFLLLMMYVPVSVLTLPAQTIITALRQTLSVFVRHLQTAIICLAFAVRNI